MKVFDYQIMVLFIAKALNIVLPRVPFGDEDLCIATVASEALPAAFEAYSGQSMFEKSYSDYQDH